MAQRTTVRLPNGLADEAEPAVVAVAAHDVDEPWLAEWLRDRVQLP